MGPKVGVAIGNWTLVLPSSRSELSYAEEACLPFEFFVDFARLA